MIKNEMRVEMQADVWNVSACKSVYTRVVFYG